MQEIENGLAFPALIPGRLLKRYKRFLADVVLDTGEQITAHCPNTGTMRACSEAGRNVFLSYHDNPKRKLKHTWELIEMPASLVGVNTMIPNRLVRHAIENGLLERFHGYTDVKPEVKVGKRHRLDLMVSKNGREPCYIEIKNCSLVEDGIACFPDAVTARGLNHLKTLQQLKKEGFQTVMFFLINRMDAEIFRPADHIDPAYGRELRAAHENGVEIMAWDVEIDLEKICLRKAVPFEL